MKTEFDHSQGENGHSKLANLVTLVFATLAGAVIIMRRLLRRPKRSDEVNGIVQSSHETMKEGTHSSTSNINERTALNPQQMDYEQQKQRLVANDPYRSWDYKAVKTATEQEKKAAHIIWKLREHERDNIFGNTATEAIPGPHTKDMGGQFLTNRDLITTKSDVYKIAVQMPKGAHLHLHFNAELAPDELIEKAKERPEHMFVRSTQPILTEKDFQETEIVFSVLPANTTKVNLFSKDYKPDFRTPGSTPWMLWKDFREVYQRMRGHDADDWAKKKMILDEQEVYGMEQTTNGIWARFNQATRCFKGLVNYESVFRWYVGAAIDNMIADGVMYAELRPMLMDKSIPSDDGLRSLDHSAQMRMILEEVRNKQAVLRDQKKFHKFPFGVKIIYCAPRSIPKTMMQREINDCIKLKLEFPDLICGFDLVGAEDRRNHIGFYRDELLAMQAECSRLNIEIPFMFHAGETLLDMGGSKDPSNSNLYDAVILKAKRIGHGFSLLKHPNLVAEFKRLDICIELCPTSNELLHLCRNIKEHPFPEILAAGIPCTINSDNPSLFTNSVSFEFYQIMVGSPSMSLHGWRQLAEWSIQYSLLSPREKQEGLQIFHDEWAKYCYWIVATYGAHADKLDVILG